MGSKEDEALSKAEGTGGNCSVLLSHWNILPDFGKNTLSKTIEKNFKIHDWGEKIF